MSQNRPRAVYIPPDLHDTARLWVDNGRRLKRLLDRVSEHNLQTLLGQKQEILARRRPTPPEVPTP